MHGARLKVRVLQILLDILGVNEGGLEQTALLSPQFRGCLDVAIALPLTVVAFPELLVEALVQVLEPRRHLEVELVWRFFEFVVNVFTAHCSLLVI